MFGTTSRTPSERPKPGRSLSKRSKQPKGQQQIPQTLPYRIDKNQSQEQYPSDGNENGRQTQEWPKNNYQQPPPPYHLSEHENPGARMHFTPLNDKEKPAGPDGCAEGEPFHRTNPFHSGSKQFPPATSYSVWDRCSDSGRSEVSAQTEPGQVDHPGATRRRKSMRHPRGASGYSGSAFDHGKTRVAPSVSGTRQYAGDDKYSEGGPDYSDSTPLGPTPGHFEGVGTRSESFSAMSDSGYKSGSTLRGVPSAGSDIGCATESGLDTSSVWTTQTDEERKAALDAAFWAGYEGEFKEGYELGLEEGSQQHQNALSDAQVHTSQLRSGAYGGERHGRWSTAVCNQGNHWG